MTNLLNSTILNLSHSGAILNLEQVFQYEAILLQSRATIITKYGSFELFKVEQMLLQSGADNLLQSKLSLLQSSALYYKVEQTLQSWAVIRK